MGLLEHVVAVDAAVEYLKKPLGEKQIRGQA